MTRWLRGERGASAVEYALILAAIAVVLIPLVIALNSVLGQVLKDSCTSTAKQNAPGTSTPADC
ncbi:MAG: Flp/Fap pilin component [Pseudonocardiales bacterium]|jgi:Flp pilus assembly pilin Flp|nr:Flp/Fap pilin component [Pseudonocardiales bacterium]